MKKIMDNIQSVFNKKERHTRISALRTGGEAVQMNRTKPIF